MGVGNAPPTGFVVELVQEETKQEVDGKALQKEAKAPMSKEEKAAAHAAKMAEQQARKAEQQAKKAEQQAKKDAQMAKKLLREEQKKEALLSGWTEVGTSPKGSNNKAVAKAKAKSMPTEAVPQLVLADDESSKKAAFRQVLKEFPTEQCDIRIAPVNFLKVDNRKGSQSWNVGVSPQGFLVPDASSGSWGTWVLTPVPNKSADGAFFYHFESHERFSARREQNWNGDAQGWKRTVCPVGVSAAGGQVLEPPFARISKAPWRVLRRRLVLFGRAVQGYALQDFLLLFEVGRQRVNTVNL